MCENQKTEAQGPKSSCYRPLSIICRTLYSQYWVLSSCCSNLNILERNQLFQLRRWSRPFLEGSTSMSFTVTATSGKKEWLWSVMPWAYQIKLRSASNSSLPSLSLSKQADYLVERGRMPSLDWCFIFPADQSANSLLTLAVDRPISLLAVSISEFSIRDSFWVVSRSYSPSSYSICMSDVGLGDYASASGQGNTSSRWEKCSPLFIQDLYFLRKDTSSSKAAILLLQVSIASCILPSNSDRLFRYKFSISTINDDAHSLNPSIGLSRVGQGGAGSLLPCRQSCLMTRQLGEDCETTAELITLQTNHAYSGRDHFRIFASYTAIVYGLQRPLSVQKREMCWGGVRSMTILFFFPCRSSLKRCGMSR